MSEELDSVLELVRERNERVSSCRIREAATRGISRAIFGANVGLVVVQVIVRECQNTIRLPLREA